MATDLTQALRTANSGLLAGQQALDVVARNIANVNTPGYTRKIVNLQQQTLAGHGAGVDFGALSRRVDQNLLSMVRREQGTLQAQTVQRDSLDRLQQLFGTTESNSSLSHALATLQGAAEALALAPQDGLEQQALVNRGQEVAGLLRRSAAEIQTLRQQADQRIDDALEEVNGLLQAVVELNAGVVRNRSVGQSAADLEDQRDKALDRLSELIDVHVCGRASGEVVVFTAGGRTLVDSTAVELTHIRAADAGATVTHAAGDFDGIYAGARTEDNDITTEIKTGQLAGLIQLRDATLPALQSTLDELSVRLRDGINAAHNRGVAYPGSASMTGTRAFRDPATQTITFEGSSDTALVLFDASGNERARTTLRTLLGGATATIDELATKISAWDFGTPLGTALSASVTAEGTLAIKSVRPGVGFALRDQVDGSAGGAAQDALLGFDPDGAGGASPLPHSGFASFFGLNDFFVDAVDSTVHDTAVLARQWSYTGAASTLTLSYAGTPPGTASIAVGSGETLQAIADRLKAQAGITAAVVPDGSGVRLRVASANGEPLTIVESGGSFAASSGLAPSNADSATTLAVRADLVAKPSLVARGAVQWDASRLPTGKYVLTPGDDTAVRQLAQTFTTMNDFAVAGKLSASSATFGEYASEFIASVSALATDNRTDAQYQNDLVSGLQQKAKSLSGVNLDEEVSDLMLYQQAYSASAQVVQVVQQMFDALDRALG